METQTQPQQRQRQMMHQPQQPYHRSFTPTFLRFRFRNKREFLLPWTFAENIHDLSFVDIVTGDKVKKLYNWHDKAKKYTTAANSE